MKRLRLIVVDGFSDFTAMEHDMLDALAGHERTLCVSLPLEKEPWRRHLLVYKTGRTQQGAEDGAADYEMQVFVYALAFEQIFGPSPDELVVYFLTSGGERTVAWNEYAREGMVAMVNQSITRLQV